MAEEIGGGGVRVDADPIDTVELGEVLGAEFLGNEWSAVAFGDFGIAGDGDKKEIALGFCEAEVADVPGMNDVEAAMTLDDSLACGAGLCAELLELVNGENLGACWARHVCVIGKRGGGTGNCDEWCGRTQVGECRRAKIACL